MFLLGCSADVCFFLMCFFFFFKQKTAYEMRISDWSSDVCSSDLGRSRLDLGPLALVDRGGQRHRVDRGQCQHRLQQQKAIAQGPCDRDGGAASDRKSVV